MDWQHPGSGSKSNTQSDSNPSFCEATATHDLKTSIIVEIPVIKPS